MGMFDPNSLYEVTRPGPVVCLIGKGKAYVIGDIAYKFARPTHDNGTILCLPPFALGKPVTWIEGQWRPASGPTILKTWDTLVTPMEE